MMIVQTQGHWHTQFSRYLFVGCLIFFVGMAQYKFLYLLIPTTSYHASIIWGIHFLIGTVWTHAIHRRYTFKEARHLSYLESLWRTYVSYAGIQGLGAVLMFFLCDRGHMDYMVGWSVTTILTSMLNFIAMRAYAIVAWENS